MVAPLKNERLKTINPEQTYILQDLAKARQQLKLTQADVAEKMNTTASAIARLEGGGGKRKHSPSLRTLFAYADALNCEIKIFLAPKNPQSPAEVKNEM